MNISNFIYEWLRQIVFVFIILSLFKIIMPKGNMKRYLDHVIGLLIIITLVFPLIKITDKDLDFGGLKLEENIDTIKPSKNILEAYNNEIENLYIGKIKEEVERIIKEGSDLQVLDIGIHIKKEGEDFGLIQAMDIVLSNNQSKKDGKEKIKINKIQTNEYTLKEEGNRSHDELGQLIAKELGIKKELINIYKN